MKNYKWILSAIILLFILGGCQESGNGEDEIELTWSTTAGYSPEAPTASASEHISGKISEFEEEYPNVNLVTDIQSSNIDEAMARILEQANSGRAPDVAAIDGYLLDRYKEYLQPLNDLMEEKGIEADDFFPFAQDVITGEDGEIYGLYMGTDTRVLYYDSEVIEEPPATWDELIETANQIQEEGYEGIVLPGGRGEGASVTTLWPLFWGQGGELVDEEGNPTFGEGENREKMLNVLETIHGAVEAGALPQRMSSYGAEGDLNEEIAGGNTAMFLGGSFQESFLEETLGEDFENWEIAPLPQIEGGEPATSSGGWTWGIFTEDPEKQEAAFDLITDTFINGEAMDALDQLPALSSIYDSEDYQGTEFTDEFRESLETEANVRPADPSYRDITVEMQTALSDVIAGNKTPEEALDDAWEVVNPN
ncbi:extracellular solute-binding protein [Alteribacillus sp. HJP-4]|uniref:extracellular solute-binding protein n=1 Tax=Alteribacillus sp. HJP-4 TaxID=2775394 RepID=UPI0035CD1D51